MVNTICKILGIARRTYFHWQKSEDKSYSIYLLNKYFTKEELEEFLETGKIEKFDIINQININNQKILKKFFFKEYTNDRFNKEFSDFLFPEFEKYIEKLILKNQKKYPNQNFIKVSYFNKSIFYEFLIENDEIMEEIKVKFNYFDDSTSSCKSGFINDLSMISESDFFIILLNYKNYLNVKIE